MKGAVFVFGLLALLAVANGQGSHVKKAMHKRQKEVKKAISNSEHDVREEEESQIDAARARDSAILAKAEMKSSHMQTMADHKMEKAEGELADIAKARHDELKDQKHASKEYKKDVKDWKKEEVETAKEVGETMKRADKLTKHMPEAERAQYWHYARQQAQHAEASRVAGVQKEATEEMKDAMWKQASRMEKDSTEYHDYGEKERAEAKKLEKSAHKDYKHAHQLTKRVDKEVAQDFKEAKKDAKREKKAELAKIKHEFYKNINRTTYTPAPLGTVGADATLTAETETQNAAVLGMVALGSFMAALFATVAVERSSRRRQIQASEAAQADAEAGPVMYEPLPGQ